MALWSSQLLLLCLHWLRGEVRGLLTCQRLWVHPLMRGLRLRRRHLPQTSSKKYFRRKRLLTFGQLLLQFTNKVLRTLLRQKFTGLVWQAV